ncbi:cilia- and flagella-associated protein 46 [Aplysia californica]|uniref:Cilia- and flagella-associated protein 46 n=1 Tax=Aplysia californica TaxID=6500 RepID=A0ABM1VS47_APLCA|nr:cilia- and flagella-associated protein 46 [Aplysia californica]
MDASIRKLLANAENYAGGEKNPALLEAYSLLRNVAETRPAVDAPESFGQDLYVLCAEFAFQNGQPDIARECLKMFFMKQPATNQFLCRAYLCQAQLLAPQNANSAEQLEKAVVYILKAISFAKKTPRYHFLVYNASVIYWQFCRPFLKPGFRQYLARSLHQVVKALDDIEDKDYEWRAQLMIALIECHLDASRRSDASHIASAAATFIKTNVSSLYKTVFGLMVRHQLVDSTKLHKDLKTSPELAVYYKICKLKNRLDPLPVLEDASSVPSSDAELADDVSSSPDSDPASENDSFVSVDQEEGRDYALDIQNILNQMGVAHKDSLLSRSQERLSQERLTRKDSKPARATSSSSSPSRDEAAETERKERKSPVKGGRRTPTPTTSRKVASDSVDNLSPAERPLLLLELARLCLELDLPELAAACVESMKMCTFKEPGFHLELEFVQCELMVRNLLEKQETYQKTVVDVRLQAIRRCEEAIMNAIRLGEPNVIQVGCVTQWNLCLPLLQPNLRNQVRKQLTVVADALEAIDSLLVLLRCQIHTELARCEEDQEQIQVAMENLKKALALDDGNIYHERLEVSLRRLELRAQLYKQPDRPEDQAAMIIEQARKADSGTIRMKRSLLVKAGEALAPDAFLLVLDSENDTKAREDRQDVSSGKGPLTKIRQLAGKAYQFNNCVKKAEGHLKRLGDENDRERARLWGDLAKTARKQEVWDVCRVASRFCLLYDDGRWKNVPPKRADSPKPDKSRSDMSKEKEDEPEKRTGSRVGSRPSTPQMVALYDKDLIRMMSEVAFINGEALVQLLRSENVQLNDKPIPPEDKSKRPKGYVAKKPEEDPDWIEYCEWIKDLSEQTTANFLRGLALGIELDEAWIVCSAAAYLWNYNNHVLTQGRHKEIVPHLTTVLAGLKKVGHAGETVMLVNICNALAQGLIRPWLPQPPKEVEKGTSEAGDPLSPKGKGGKGAPTPAKTKSPGISISPEATPDLKKAIEVCDFAMQVTNGENPRDVVPIFMRLPILQTWVRAKQMAQQQISKLLGTDDENNNTGQRPMTRAIVAVEMLGLTKNGIMEFKDVPFIGDIAQMIEDAKWSDKFVELQLWSRLTYLAYEAHLHNMVVRCSKKALRFAGQGTQPRTRKMDLHRYAVEQEMLCYSSVLLGQSLVDNMKGKNSLRREALEAFLNSTKYARSAGNYELVMIAARHFWNTCIALVGQPIERELLKEPLKIILECIAATADKAKKEEKPEEQEEEKKDDGDEKDQDESQEKDHKEAKAQEAGQGKAKEPEKMKSGMIGKPEDDLTLRASMYGVLFQSYADQGEWIRALEAIDQAVADMPRTKHRLLIFKHRVMVKAKLGRSVHMDIQKFKDESEDFVAHMWRRVALSSKEAAEQLASYQSAIESLENESNDFQKVEYLLEFAQWLYSNHFSLGDVQDQLEWAVDILLNMKSPEEPPAPKPTEVKKGKGSRRRLPSGSDSKSTVSKGKKGGDKDGASVRSKTPDKVGKKAATRKDSARSKGSSVDRKAGRQAGKLAPAAHAADGKSEVSDQDSEINAMDYVPVVKEADIGVLPANPSLTVKDLTDVRQLDALIRAHVLLAEIFGRESEQHKDILLMAHAYLMQFWQVLIHTCANGIKEVVKNGGTLVKEEPPKSGKGAPGGKDKKADDKDKKKEEKPKPKRKCPVDAIPSDLETWATYDWPDEGIEAFKMDTLKSVAVSQENVPKPMLTLHYTNSLISQLRDVGYNHLALPVLAFQDLLSRTVLKNSALFKLVHLRSLEICQELDIKSACAHHMKILEPIHITEEDQAYSRDEIAQWKEKQTQVAQEELRVKETLARMTSGSPSRPKAPTGKSAPLPSEVAKNEGDVKIHLGKVLGSVSLRDVWTDTAEVLIRQGHYQRAREYLNEANIAAEAFADINLKARIRHLLASLAFFEAQYGQTINLCETAQAVKEGEERFWYDSIVLLAEATVKEVYDINTVRKAKKILVHAINEFSKVGDENPNRKNMSRYYCSKLEALLLHIHMESILHSRKDLNNPQLLKAVLEGCDRYESIAEQMVSLRCWREAVPVVMEHARLLKLLAHESPDKDLRRVYFIRCQSVIKQAVNLAERVYTDVHTLFPLWQMKPLSTPVQRELASVKIEMADLLTDILVARDKELRQVQLQEERKQSIVRLVEDFIRETPVYEGTEKQWIEIGRIAGDEAVSHLLSAHSLGANIPRLKAKSLVGIGRLLRVVADFHGPDPTVQWMVHDVEVLRMQLAAEEAEAEAAAAEAAALEAANKEENPEEDAANADETDKKEEENAAEEEEAREEEKVEEVDEKVLRQQAKYAQQMTKKKDQLEMSKYFYMCASECLAQALNCCLQQQYIDLAAKASLEMFVLTGQYDPAASSMMLSLHQSCEAALMMKGVLVKSQPDPMTSKLAALLHQRAHMLHSDVTTNLSGSGVFKDTITALHTDWQAWKRLGISPNHLDLLKEFPSNYNFIVLQHSPDKTYLYGAVLDKPKGAGPTGAAAGKAKGQDKAKGKISPNKIKSSVLESEDESDVSRARVFGSQTDFSRLKEILTELQEHKTQVQAMLLKREYQRTQAAQRQRMLEGLDDDQKVIVKASSETALQEAELEEEFENIVGAMNDYLRPVLEPICHSLRDALLEDLILRSGSTPLGSNPNIAQEAGGKDKGTKEHQPQNECVVLLVDSDLMHLPLEANTHLEIIEGVNSVSRDFSLELLHARMHDEKQAEPDPKEAKGEGKKKAPKEPVNFVSRIPGVREAKQKQAKIIPLDRHPQAWQVAANTMDFRYITDANLECAETEPNKPIEEFEKVLLQYEQQFTPRWLGVPGNDHTPSVGEWEIYLTESTSFIFYGLERLLSYIPPHKMAALNIPECNILFSFDLAETSKSFQRQSKLDVLKTPVALSLENPVEAAILASLGGIRCVIGNQWHCTLAENANKMHATMKYLLEKGKTTGQALYLLQNPMVVYEEEKALQKAAEAGKEATSEPPTGRKKSIAHEKGSVKDGKTDAKSEAAIEVKPSESDPDKDVEESKEEEDMPVVTRSSFNTICYGMPNIIITQ